MWEIFEMLCNQKGVTPTAVARATGVPQTTLSNWKVRRNYLNTKAAKKIADYFGVSLEYLMTGKDPDGYYENDETAEIAQKIHDNREMRMLFSAAKDVSPDVLEELYEMLLIIKRRETR